MRTIGTVALVLLALLASSCAERPAPEQQAMRLIEEIERLVVAGATRQIEEKVSESYRDEAGRDRRMVMTLLNLALRDRNVHLWKHVQHLEAVEPGRVRVSVSVAAAAEPIYDPGKLGDIQADLLHFDAVVVEEDDGVWRVTSAVWRDARLDDFF